MNFLLTLLAIGFLVSGSVVGMSCIPNQDIMTWNGDGELMTIWGEHNFYQDTSSFGLDMWLNNGTVCIGGTYAR